MRSLARWSIGLAGLGLCRCTDTAPHAQGAQLTPCRLEGLGVEARCGNLSVFEDRALHAGRRIELRYAVVPALAASPKPDPLFVLVGGPGQAATKSGVQIAEALRDVQRTRDIVLVDQRGTGGSHPLSCKEETEDGSLAKRFAPRLDIGETRACREALDAVSSHYTTDIAMDDLDDVRQALGYERINLWGGSYGTRAALVYFRQHREHVRSLTLDGAAPFAIELPLYVGRDGQRALDLLYADCSEDAECRAAFPDAKLALDQLLSRLAAAPEPVQINHPRTGLRESVRIEREGLASVLLNLLYVPELAGLLPLGVQRASGGDWSTLVASAEAFSDAVALSTGMFLSVVCAEDIARISDTEAEEQTHGTFLGGEWLGRLRTQCGEWKSAVLPDSYFEPVSGQVPSLILSGNLDPVTPPVWGELVASRLTPSRHIVVPGAGHGVSSLGCLPKLISEFIDGLAPARLDPSCIEARKRPPFFTSLEGPSP
jgi:pimeloyl-ACP methyl ester carboxylesterase